MGLFQRFLNRGAGKVDARREALVADLLVPGEQVVANTPAKPAPTGQVGYVFVSTHGVLAALDPEELPGGTAPRWRWAYGDIVDMGFRDGVLALKVAKGGADDDYSLWEFTLYPSPLSESLFEEALSRWRDAAGVG